MSTKKDLKDVLVVDLNKGICGVFDIICSERNLTFDVTSRVDEALSLIKENKYRVMILDKSINTQSILADKRRIIKTKVIFSTCEKPKDDILELKRSGALVKPFYRSDAEKMIQRKIRQYNKEAYA